MREKEFSENAEITAFIERFAEHQSYDAILS